MPQFAALHCRAATSGNYLASACQITLAISANWSYSDGQLHVWYGKG